jgi:hypothetical protein
MLPSVVRTIAQSGAVYGQARNEFGDEMLRVGGGVSMPENNQLADGLRSFGGQTARCKTAS